jgi:(p)ppGpp synthase/HD superfamily hydrolase
MIRAAMTDEDSPDPERALAWAREQHGGQLYGGRPYGTHLLAAAEVLRDCGYGDDPALMSAAYLHDTIEDTSATREQIAALFGARIAGIVDAVSDPDGDTRAEKKAAAYPRIRAIDDAVRVKLADRIANVEAGGPKREMYRGEQAGFREALHKAGVADDMWAHLESLLSPPGAAAG